MVTHDSRANIQPKNKLHSFNEYKGWQKSRKCFPPHPTLHHKQRVPSNHTSTSMSILTFNRLNKIIQLFSMILMIIWVHSDTITFSPNWNWSHYVSDEARPCSPHLGGEWKMSANNDNVTKATAAYPTLSNNEVKVLCLNFGFAWKRKRGQWTEDRWRLSSPSTPLV